MYDMWPVKAKGTLIRLRLVMRVSHLQTSDPINSKYLKSVIISGLVILEQRKTGKGIELAWHTVTQSIQESSVLGTFIIYLDTIVS